ncbi:MAG: hypothetical protein A2711_11825 [Burkholderiales bacterium RIFCSPHIGHO2_01_FULL_63_240]|jgi:PAS domain S-box-containing protein|nr:MAG: hypothetical protein A2711_11825 [Burkholderiales bacterium RIFCSPHIGHO2_01_FULL_63_240]
MPLHHSHRLAMRQALGLVGTMILGLVVIRFLPFQEGFHEIEDFLPIHTLLEMVAVVIAVLVFASGWNAYSRHLPRHGLILACAFLGVAMLDFAHAMSFGGMPEFVTAGNQQRTVNFWLAARLLAATALLAVAVLPPEKPAMASSRYGWLIGVLAVVGAFYWVFLFRPEWVPPTYLTGTGLTSFKIAAEYSIVGMNVVAACSLWQRMRRPLRFNAAALFGTVSAMALSELCFTMYATMSDIYNVTGHVYKVVSYLFLYRAVFVEVIQEPYREMARMGDQLRATLDAVPDVMLEMDLHGRYHAVHSSRLETLILPPRELIGRTVHDVLNPEDARVVMSALEAALANGTSSGTQLQVAVPRGLRWFELSVSRKGDLHGLDTRFIVLSRDITERKEAEAAVLEQEAMAQANRAKSQFLSRVSHELRTPLNAVIGFAQLLLHDANARMAAGQRLHVEYILRAGQHLLEMINDILDLTRIESGDADLKTAPMRLGDVISDSLPMVLPQAEAMGVSVSVDVSRVERHLVLVEARRVKQVLINVLSNAVKYNRVGGQITVHGSIDELEPGRLVLSIADTGRGLNTAQMKNLFEPFNRLGADRLGIEGTGLGLVIARRLIEAMGGEIAVDSTEGVGTTVTLRLPLVEGAQAVATTPAMTVPEAVRHRQVPDQAHITVLCIEDNPLNAALVRAISDLRPAVKFLIAEDGEAGIERTRNFRPDLVLIDINLPDMSGVEVLQRLRAMDGGAGLTCIAISADVSGDPRARALSQGFDDFWSKPLDVDSVLLKLDKVLARAHARRAADAPVDLATPASAAAVARPDPW